MKKETGIKFGIFLLIATILMPIMVYAKEDIKAKEENTFFLAEKQEASPGDIIYLTLDLQNISYEKLSFSLSTQEEIEEIKVEQSEVETQIDETNGTDLELVVDRNNTNLKTIVFSIKIPDNQTAGSTITFTGSITEIVKQTEENTNEIANTLENSIANMLVEDNNVVTEKQGETITETITIQIVDKETEKEQEIEQETETEQEKEKEENITDSSSSTAIPQVDKQNTTSSNLQSVSSSRTSTSSFSSMSLTAASEETVTYEGESNNYLASLVIEGYDLLPSFAKTNQTYILEVPNDVTSVQISATAEDENAKVRIYGGDNLSEGENKILIFVTAENGEVKTYRIYLTRES